MHVSLFRFRISQLDVVGPDEVKCKSFLVQINWMGGGVSEDIECKL